MTTSDKAHFLCFPICGARKSLPEPIGKDNEVPQEYTVAHYFAEAPEDIQIMILRKLAKDRSSFLAFSFANKHNLSMVLQTSFWRELLVSEGRGPSDKNLDLQKLFNLYYRRLYRCEGVEVRQLDFKGLLTGFEVTSWLWLRFERFVPVKVIPWDVVIWREWSYLYEEHANSYLCQTW